MPKTRLDLLMVERGLADSRSLAQRLIMAGEVRVNGQVVYKPATSIPTDSELEVDTGSTFCLARRREVGGRFRGFPDRCDRLRLCRRRRVHGWIHRLPACSTGHAKVYAIDVGKGILHWKLRSDPRVVVMEETNARFVESLPEPVQWVVCDASFISLKILLPVMKKWTPLRLPPNSMNLGEERRGEAV